MTDNSQQPTANNQQSTDTSPHILGIRHHGPGSARSLVRRLAELEPDCVLVEGPADGNEILHWLGHEEMAPPIALLLYRPDQPNRASFFPFAEFSPEFQALTYGLKRGITTRFMDLPQMHMMAAEARPKMPETAVFKTIAQAAGVKSYEQWWHMLIEQRQDSIDIFEAIQELMGEMRSAGVVLPVEEGEDEDKSQRVAEQREAFMRRTIRQAIGEGHEKIAIVCGAWHGPALTDLSNEEADEVLLADMPSVPVEAAWVPWTYGRLSTTTGYGAGIYSPGWYHHLWESSGKELTTAEISSRWLAKVATMLRGEDLDASPAHVIEAVRLAEALAAMRELPFPSLEELNEASQTILCEGHSEPMTLIKKKLIISERMGIIPPDTPMVPLQRDIYMQQQRLRLHPDPNTVTHTFDLRQKDDLARSLLLHRMGLLGIAWGKLLPKRSKQPGTFSEVWRLTWTPSLTMQVIEAAMWGNTIEDAAASFAQDKADNATDLASLTKLLNEIIPADLPQTVLYLMNRIEEQAAVSSDIPLMMDALIPLAQVFRYGSVRQLDEAVIRHVIDGLVTRICIGLPTTCQALDDDAASEMMGRLLSVHTTINSLQNEAHQERWQEALRKVVDQPKVPGGIAGKACRLLLDSRAFTTEDAQLRMERVLSLQTAVRATNEELTQMANWLDGFLQGSGLLVLHDNLLWSLLDSFVTQLDDERFQTVLPLLRRTFSSFSESAREQINRRIRQGVTAVAPTDPQLPTQFDQEKADAILPTLAGLLGIEMEDEG